MQVKIYFVFSKRALNIYGTHSIALYRLGYLLIYLSYFSSRERAASSQKWRIPDAPYPGTMSFAVWRIGESLFRAMKPFDRMRCAR